MDKLPATLQFLGPEKKREQDTVLRMMCVEILLLLSTSESLDILKQKDTLTWQRIPVVRVCGIEGHTTSSERPTKSRRINRYVPIAVPDIWSWTDGQIKEAIERLVSLIEGEESHETREQHIAELLRAEKAAKEEEDVGGELDVVEV
jgi:hypothetical protein